MFALALQGLIAGLGVGLQAYGAKKSYEGSKAQSQASAEAEGLRKQQMTLEFGRKQREIYRQAQQARAASLSAATNQGAGEGSGAAGGQAQITSDYYFNRNQNEQALGIGQGIFDANIKAAKAGSQVALGQGFQSFGGQLTQNAQAFGRVGAQVYGTGMNIFNIGSDPWQTTTRRFE